MTIEARYSEVSANDFEYRRRIPTLRHNEPPWRPIGCSARRPRTTASSREILILWWQPKKTTKIKWINCVKSPWREKWSNNEWRPEVSACRGHYSHLPRMTAEARAVTADDSVASRVQFAATCNTKKYTGARTPRNRYRQIRTDWVITNFLFYITVPFYTDTCRSLEAQH